MKLFYTDYCLDDKKNVYCEKQNEECLKFTSNRYSNISFYQCNNESKI